jgi:tetratricopeptide (TPR) repeat protein
MSVKIFTMTHKKFEEPKDAMYVPLQVGKAVKEDLGYLGDNTGENISELNDCYSELTGVYWIWKNYHFADYVGVCHYRRYLINKKGKIYQEFEFLELLKEYDIITSKKLKYDYTYYDGYADAHNINDLIETGKVIKEKYPEYYDNFERLVHSNESYFGNIMVTSKVLFDEYASWLFDILLEVQRRIDISSYDDYHKRVFGFISEFLLMVWVNTRNLKVYECMVGMSDEKHETKEMKEKLAVYFKNRDIQGAKDYFMECYQKRPDVLLEASDITGELKLSMQVIATCENERMNQINSIIDRINDFSELMSYFRNINNIVNRYMTHENSEEDIQFLHKNQVSYLAINIAVMLFSENSDSVNTLLSIADDLTKVDEYDTAIHLLRRCLEYDSNNQTVMKKLNAVQNHIANQ